VFQSPDPNPTTQYTCSFCAKAFEKPKNLKFVTLAPIPSDSLSSLQS
jgi:hypothetical protein